MRQVKSSFGEAAVLAVQEHPGWIRLWDLRGEFQLFLIDEMFEYPTATKFIDGEFYVSLDLVHKYTEHDLDWTKPRIPNAATPDRSKLVGNWYPLHKLSHPVLYNLFADYIDERSFMKVVDDVLYVSTYLLHDYTTGGDTWLYKWADEDANT